jgi:uncharacterized paraquat-inducible protein A
MAGCFGNHPFDRAMERQLFDWLDSQDTVICPNCGFEICIDDFEDDEDIVCPKCETIIKEI